MPGITQHLFLSVSRQPDVDSHMIVSGAIFIVIRGGHTNVAQVAACQGGAGAGVAGTMQHLPMSAEVHPPEDWQPMASGLGLKTMPTGQTMLAQVPLFAGPGVRHDWGDSVEAGTVAQGSLGSIVVVSSGSHGPPVVFTSMTGSQGPRGGFGVVVGSRHSVEPPGPGVEVVMSGDIVDVVECLEGVVVASISTDVETAVVVGSGVVVFAAQHTGWSRTVQAS